MENYILNILETNNRVIVPDFGAFIVKQRNPLIIVFNEFLQYNDGILVDVISKKENSERADAKQKIEDFVKKIRKTLDKGEKYELSKLGLLAKNSVGKISLEESNKPDSPKPVSKKQTDTLKNEKKNTEIKETDPEKSAGIKAKEKEKPVKKDTSPEEKKSPKNIRQAEIAKETDVQKPAQPLIRKNDTPDKQPEKKKEIVSKSDPYDNSAANNDLSKSSNFKKGKDYESIERDDSPKNRRKNLIIWIIIVLVNGSILGYFWINEDLGELFRKSEKADAIPETFVEEIPEKDTTATFITGNEYDNTPSDESTAGHEIKAKKKEILTGPRHHVVAGVFRIEENADNLVLELQKKGYNAEKFGKIGNLHAVSYDVFENKQDADRLMLKIRRELDPEVWIKTIN